MDVTFLLDEDRPVQVIHNFLRLLPPRIQPREWYDGTDVLVNYCIYRKPERLPAERYINFVCDLGDRYSVVNACNQTLVEQPTFPGDYMVRLPAGHGNQAKSHRIRSQGEYDKWLQENPGDHIVQRFIDTSIKGQFYSGRVGRAGSEFFPLYACQGDHWNTNVYSGNLRYFDDGPDCFYMIPGINSLYTEQRFWKQVYNKCDEIKLDLGFIDFSLNRGELVVWEATTAVVFEAPKNLTLDAHKRKIIDTVCNYLQVK